jgi:hypothetical protein
MSEEIADNSWAEENPWTGSITGGPDGSTGVPLTGSNGEYILAPEVEGLFRDVYPMVSNNVEEEEKILAILRRGTYNEEERTFLREKLTIHSTQYLTWIQSLDE